MLAQEGFKILLPQSRNGSGEIGDYKRGKGDRTNLRVFNQERRAFF